MMKTVLLFMMLSLGTTMNAQVSEQDKQQQEKGKQQQEADIFVLNHISSETRNRIDNALTYNLGEDFERMTPLQKKNYLASEEGKSKIAELEQLRKRLFSATWCFSIRLDGNNSNDEFKHVYYHLGFERMMLHITSRYSGKPLDINDDLFKFNKDYLYEEDLRIIKLCYLSLPCSEEVATEIETNDKDLVLYLYFKVPGMDAVTIKYGKPYLAVKVDKVELRNIKTDEIYITTVM